MTSERVPSDWGTAQDHGPAIIAARNNFLPEIYVRMPRASVSDAESFLDYMIACRYLSNEFFAAWDLQTVASSKVAL